MNNPSPLVPQGSFADHRNQSRARVRLAVFLVLSIHCIGLLALLMQGCKKEPEATFPLEPSNNPTPVFQEPTNALPATNDTLVAAPPTNIPVVEPVVEPPPIAPVVPPPAPATEYKIVQGDNYTTIAKRFQVTVKALMEANPGVEPTKLRIGQSIRIPAPTASASNGAASLTGAAAEQTYVVKSGDNLNKIASRFGVTYKALRAANDLTTDRIVVGQKLKIPAKPAASSPGGTSAPAATPPGI